MFRGFSDNHGYCCTPEGGQGTGSHRKGPGPLAEVFFYRFIWRDLTGFLARCSCLNLMFSSGRGLWLVLCTTSPAGCRGLTHYLLPECDDSLSSGPAHGSVSAVLRQEGRKRELKAF